MKRISLLIVAALCVMASCADDDNEAIEDIEVESDGAHILPPTDEMVSIARQQCEDGREQGVVELARPETGEIVSRAVVDC